MKRNFLIIAGICCLFLFAGQVNAQKEEYNKAMRYRHMPYEKQVEEVLTNLTDSQREALHKLSKENKEYMNSLKGIPIAIGLRSRPQCTHITMLFHGRKVQSSDAHSCTLLH